MNPINLPSLFPWFDRMNTMAGKRPAQQDFHQGAIDGINIAAGFAGVAAAALVSIAHDLRQLLAIAEDIRGEVYHASVAARNIDDRQQHAEPDHREP